MQTSHFHLWFCVSQHTFNACHVRLTNNHLLVLTSLVQVVIYVTPESSPASDLGWKNTYFISIISSSSRSAKILVIANIVSFFVCWMKFSIKKMMWFGLFVCFQRKNKTKTEWISYKWFRGLRASGEEWWHSRSGKVFSVCSVLTFAHGSVCTVPGILKRKWSATEWQVRPFWMITWARK